MELLIPAGNKEKLISAVQYGANAVYLSGQKFGLREASDNFNHDDLKLAVEFCHSHQVKVYVTLNGFLHDEDLSQVKDYILFLNDINCDALIISDLGLITYISDFNTIPIHLSTQASCVNTQAALFWKSFGVTRVILGREITLEEAAQIKLKTQLEVELFIHGSLCMSYSGNCTISNFTQGRDSNRGGCAQSCRFDYSFSSFQNLDQEPQNQTHQLSDNNSYFMSSKDLNGIELLPLFKKYGIDSLKVEGRMKSEFYAGVTTKAYRQAIDLVQSNEFDQFYQRLPHFLHELNKYSHRSYTTASLEQKAGSDSIYNERESETENQHNFLGKVIGTYQDDMVAISVKKKFTKGSLIEFHTFEGANQTIEVSKILDLDMEEVASPRPSSVVLLPVKLDGLQENTLISMAGENAT